MIKNETNEPVRNEPVRNPVTSETFKEVIEHIEENKTKRKLRGMTKVELIEHIIELDRQRNADQKRLRYYQGFSDKAIRSMLHLRQEALNGNRFGRRRTTLAYIARQAYIDYP